MYQVNNLINDQEYKELQIRKLKQQSNLEILSISLEKGSKFPEHTSPEDAELILLEGEIIFHINNEAYSLTPYQSFAFPKKTPHWVMAVKNSKFVLIR